MKELSILLTAAALFLAGNAGAAGSSAIESAGLSLDGAAVPAAAAPEAVGQPDPGAGAPVHGFSSGERAGMAAHNAGLLREHNKGLAFEGGEERVERRYRPFADYEAPGYLIMSSDFNFNSRQAKMALASQLPADATLVIFTDTYNASKEQVLRDYEGVVPRSRIKVVTLPGARNGFWARDGIPVPVMDASGRLVVVDAVYGHRFEPDAEIARLFGAGLEKHRYYYEGGNFMANHSGDCIMVNHGAHTQIPDSVFTAQYGCRRMIRLPFVDGIGHIDEHVRFITERTLVTDLPAYQDTLRGLGFDVRLLPKPSGPYETYVNSLLMNDRVVVPVFNRDTDSQALAVYESLGLKAVPADSRALSNRGQGSVHCITMTYPKVPAAELMKALGASEL